MFLLKKHWSSANQYVDCDEFGWWLSGSKPDHRNYEDPLTSDGISTASSPSTVSCYDAEDSESFDDVGESESPEEEITNDQPEPEDPREICYAEEPPCKTSSRSYTPERLIRNLDYSILVTSPTSSSTPVTTPCKRFTSSRHRRLNHLIDRQLVGASHLEALLDPDALDIKLPVVVARRRKQLAVRSSRTEDEEKNGDLLAIANSRSPERLLTPDLMSSSSSCERLDCQEVSERVSGKFSERVNAQRENTLLRKTSGSLAPFHENARNESNSVEDEVLTDHAWRVSRVVDFVTVTSEDPENVVRLLRGRIEHIRDINRDIFEDLSSLRRDFQWTEKKTGSLTTATTRLRQEIRDLRYLDDLVNLLRGELERISRRNWPFNLGHTEHHAEEVNLVV